MFQQNSLKKILIMLPLGIVSATGVFFGNGGEVGNLGTRVDDLAPVKVVRVADLSQIDWEIEIVEEWQLAQK